MLLLCRFADPKGDTMQEASATSQSIAIRDLVTLQSLTEAGMNLVSITISPLAKAAGTPVPQLALPRDCVLVALVRGEDLIYPRGDTTLQPWDSLFAVVDQAAEEQLRTVLTQLP